MMILILKLILAHLIGDFFLQPLKWVKDKEKMKLKDILHEDVDWESSHLEADVTKSIRRLISHYEKVDKIKAKKLKKILMDIIKL